MNFGCVTMKGSKGKMHGTRRKLRNREDVSPNKFLKDFEPGDKVQINIEPSSHSGMPHPRFQGKVGKILGKRGQAFQLKIKEGGKEKEFNITPEHLQKVENS